MTTVKKMAEKLIQFQETGGTVEYNWKRHDVKVRVVATDANHVWIKGHKVNTVVRKSELEPLRGASSN